MPKTKIKIKEKLSSSRHTDIAFLVDKMPTKQKEIPKKVFTPITIMEPITEEEEKEIYNTPLEIKEESEEEIKNIPLNIIKENNLPKEFNNTSIEKDIIVSSGKSASDLILSLNMLLDDKNIKGKTILDNRQVTAITLMNWAGQVYDIPFLNEFVHNWCRYRISGDGGKGRQDLISIAQAIQLEKSRERELDREMLKK
jgi:hypothetical protein